MFAITSVLTVGHFIFSLRAMMVAASKVVPMMWVPEKGLGFETYILGLNINISQAGAVSNARK